MKEIVHKPVLLHEVIDALDVKPGGVYLDCTLGSAGHTIEILKKGGQVYGLDVDPKAIDRAKERVKQVCPDTLFTAINGNFINLNQLDLPLMDGILMDLGFSSDQLQDKEKGFSFQIDAKLDMRLDPDLQVTAKDLVNGLTHQEMVKLFTNYGEETWADKIAKAIVASRKVKPIETTLELASIIKSAKKSPQRIHPATQVFQALRIAVNDELNNLKLALPQAVKLLKPKGILAVISFHSLEDRIVKNFIQAEESLVKKNQKPITAEIKEILANPRSRSAKLRLAYKK